MPSLPFELTDENDNVLWRFDEGGALIQYRADGTKMTELYDGIQHFSSAEVCYARTDAAGTAHFDAAGNRIVDVMLDGGVTVWRPNGIAAVQCWFDGTDGRATAYNADGSVRADL